MPASHTWIVPALPHVVRVGRTTRLGGRCYGSVVASATGATFPTRQVT